MAEGGCGKSSVRTKKYMILDEPTASIDPIAESEMYRSFFAAMRNRTSVVVSHRLASATFADKIIVIKSGIVAESGTHQELIHRNGIYAHMWKMQSSWYQEAKDEE